MTELYNLIIYMGFWKLHRIADYWSKKLLYNTPFLRSSMSWDRFSVILWNLHLSDPNLEEENIQKKNLLHTTGSGRSFLLVAHILPLERNLAVDERMVATKE